MKDDFLSHADAAQLNRNIVLHYIMDNEPVSRTDIWEAMSISRASVTQIIRQLLEAGLVIETDERRATAGRQQRYLRINRDARRLFAFDWTGRLLCLVNMGGEILDREALAFPEGNFTPTAFSAVLVEGLRALRARHPELDNHKIDLGMAMPGNIDSRRNAVLYSVELGWRDVNLRRLFADCYDGEVYAERMANMMVLGELAADRKHASEHSTLVLLEKVGLGMAAIVHGNCQHGGNYMFGELGHIKLPVNTYCSCGQRGCLEAVVKDLLMANGGVVDAQIMEYIAIGVSTAVNILDSDKVRLVGHLVEDMSFAQEEELRRLIVSKVSNERSRRLQVCMGGDYTELSIKGISAHIFNHWYAVD